MWIIVFSGSREEKVLIKITKRMGTYKIISRIERGYTYLTELKGNPTNLIITIKNLYFVLFVIAKNENNVNGSILFYSKRSFIYWIRSNFLNEWEIKFHDRIHFQTNVGISDYRCLLGIIMNYYTWSRKFSCTQLNYLFTLEL